MLKNEFVTALLNLNRTTQLVLEDGDLEGIARMEQWSKMLYSYRFLRPWIW